MGICEIVEGGGGFGALFDLNFKILENGVKLSNIKT